MGWIGKIEAEGREERYVESMKEASVVYEGRREDLRRKYVLGEDWKRK